MNQNQTDKVFTLSVFGRIWYNRVSVLDSFGIFVIIVKIHAKIMGTIIITEWKIRQKQLEMILKTKELFKSYILFSSPLLFYLFCFLQWHSDSLMFYDHFLTVFREAEFRSHGWIRRSQCQLQSKKNMQVRMTLESLLEKTIFKAPTIYYHITIS